MYEKYKAYSQRQAGIAYEAFVAHTLREDGWQVNENGRLGIHDHGIDLIASKDGVKRYVQCKGWNINRTIHDDVVSQLYGSVAAIEGPNNLEGVEMYIYSPAQIDEYAKNEAARLNIQFVQLNFPAWHHRYHHRYHYKRAFTAALNK